MTVTTKSLALIVILAALIASAFTYTITSLAQPQVATASDTQIVNAIKKYVGSDDYSGMRGAVLKALGRSEYDSNSVRGQIKAACVALGGASYQC